MKTLTIIQAAALLMLAVIGAYAGQHTGDPNCAAPVATAEACEL